MTILVFLLSVTINAPASAEHKNLTLGDLKKAAFRVEEMYDTKPSGVYYLDIPKKVDGSGPPAMLSLAEYAFGDLNGDGLGDAVAFVGLNGGGTGQFMSLVALVNDHGKAKSVDYVTLGDRTGCNALKIKEGKVIFDALVHPNELGAAWGTVPKRAIYTLKNNKLIGPRHLDG